MSVSSRGGIVVAVVDGVGKDDATGGVAVTVVIAAVDVPVDAVEEAVDDDAVEAAAADDAVEEEDDDTPDTDTPEDDACR